jgi:hypothetical protein
MAATLKDLAKRLRKAASTRPDSVVSTISNEKAQRVAIAFLRDVVEHTPVDTTLAVSNWLVAIGDMPSLATNSIRTAYSYGSGGATAEASRAAAIAVGTAAILTKKPGESIYVYNLAPYIRRLNDGLSAQEAAGFVERARLVASKVD